MRAIAPLTMLLALAACEDPPAEAPVAGSTTPRYERVESDSSLLAETTTPVRIGELGPSFAACNSRGTTRRLVAESGETLAVRAAPFQSAQEIAQLPAGSAFFICSRSLDQKWFGVVFDEGGTASPRCAVSAAVSRRQDYQGPCNSGWVNSAYVKLVAGTQPPAQAGDDPANPSNPSES